MKSSDEIRDAFLKYFERNGHRIVPSSSLIPFNDPTLLFTNAGMNQFKDVFLGNEERPYRRATTSQKCMRVSGKHNDFRDVGHSTRHHTFFEMLGNFSFGDYFKSEAIRFAWELVTRDFGVDPARLWITVYQEDDEAWHCWRDEIGILSERILRLCEEDNFWAMGETGPCGPCSELHYDFGSSPLPDHGDCDLTCSCGRWIEIWNLVFMQFNRDSDGKMTPLPSPSIDTGMGFERITTILQGKQNNYETDLFRPLLDEVSRIANLDYGANPQDDVSMRIIADHARAAAFVIADGQYPGNDKRGYVIRKIMRRAAVHGKKLQVHEPFIYRVAGVVGDLMRRAYPELAATRDTIARVIKQEEEAFADTLDKGLRDFYDRARRLKAGGSKVLPGAEAFYLYDTRGLPLEIIEDLAQEYGLAVDEAGFQSALEEQRERARQDYLAGRVRQEVAETVFEGSSCFVGYGYQVPVHSVIVAILVGGERAESIASGQKGEIVLDSTPFYAESGGQVGDTGVLSGGGNKANVLDTIYRGSAISHVVEVTAGELQVGDRIQAAVDLPRREATMRNHTATHLMHAALKQVLGPHVKQAGSLVAPDRLRFDFTHFAPLTAAEIEQIENEVNAQIWRNEPLVTQVMDLDHAMQSGAVALFGEKYQERVRVVEVPGFSKELCGGTHVPATGTIGMFKILSETGVAAGVRRIEALTGAAALARFRADAGILDEIQEQFRVTRQDVPALLEKMQGQIRELQRQIAQLRVEIVRAGLGDIVGQARRVRGVPVIAHVLPATDRVAMREIADDLKARLGSGIVVLGTPQDGKAALIAMVTRDLCERIPAGKIIREIAPIVGGSGGGKPELAEAGGKDSSKLADAIERTYSVVEALLSR
ncbi:MAG: alanine--tRNA ligase [Acidobacteria bacterium]|nr:alanine--tRNA ligase [Acidobacteriota bacterium]